ncbi:MAG TPA: Uma2 family endonuclease [Candidatus Ozemobacteraceae bacterium]|nr:Uma2 family endonuclease [Candidatus Ozemobacteraceae bacterium]
MKRKSSASKTLDSSKKLYTYADYCTWPDDERWELMDGEAVAMTPGPGPDHQRLSRKFCTQIDTLLEGQTCEMFNAPIDVLLPDADEPDEQVKTVLQPDVLVVCDPSKITRRGIRGGPDFVIEVLSPSSASRDQIRKRRLYERFGVKEYWVVDPEQQLVWVYRRGVKAGKNGVETLTSDFQVVQAFDVDDKAIEIVALPGLTIDLTRIFPPRPKVVRERPRYYSV